MTLTKEQKSTLLKKYKQQIESGELILIKDKAKFRKEWWLKQDKICPILKDEIPFNKTSIDHQHKLKSDELGGKDRLGLVRAILHLEANALEGKIINFWNRSSLKKEYDLPTILRNLADYYENEYPIPPKYIYPGEQPIEERRKLGKRDYNKVIKYYFKMYPRRKKLPKKSKYLTKEWETYILNANSYIKGLQINKQKKKKRK